MAAGLSVLPDEQRSHNANSVIHLWPTNHSFFLYPQHYRLLEIFYQIFIEYNSTGGYLGNHFVNQSLEILMITGSWSESKEVYFAGIPVVSLYNMMRDILSSDFMFTHCLSYTEFVSQKRPDILYLMVRKKYDTARFSVVDISRFTRVEKRDTQI